MFKRILGLTLIFALIAGSSFAQTAVPAADSHKPVLRIVSTGGLCANGPCGGLLMIYDEGMCIPANAVKNDTKKAPCLRKTDIKDLIELIEQTDFSKLRIGPFTGMCPTAYDGHRAIYVFYTSQGEEVLDTCKDNIDFKAPFFNMLNEILGRQAVAR